MHTTAELEPYFMESIHDLSGFSPNQRSVCWKKIVENVIRKNLNIQFQHDTEMDVIAI